MWWWRGQLCFFCCWGGFFFPERERECEKRWFTWSRWRGKRNKNQRNVSFGEFICLVSKIHTEACSKAWNQQTALKCINKFNILHIYVQKLLAPCVNCSPCGYKSRRWGEGGGPPALVGVWLPCALPSAQALALFPGGEPVCVAATAAVHKRPAFPGARVEVPEQSVLRAGPFRHGLQAAICSWNGKKEPRLKQAVSLTTSMITSKWENGGCFKKLTDLVALLSHYAPINGFMFTRKKQLLHFCQV